VLTGTFPNVSALALLKMLYLSWNRISGVIPEGALGPMRGLRKLSLRQRVLRASARIHHLAAAAGAVARKQPLRGPAAGLLSARAPDVANNSLSGPIPTGLSRFNGTMFAGIH
jgi:hypothetical protein